MQQFVFDAWQINGGMSWLAFITLLGVFFKGGGGGGGGGGGEGQHRFLPRSLNETLQWMKPQIIPPL